MPGLDAKFENDDRKFQFNDQIEDFKNVNAYDQDSNQIDSFSKTKNHADQQKEAYQLMNRAIIKQKKLLNIDSMELQNLDFLYKQSWNTLQEIYVSRNQLSDLSTLNQYPNLKLIDASNNYLTKVILSTKKLEKLFLQINFIDEFPTFIDVKRLQILNLNNNKIKEIKQIQDSYLPELQNLELSHNQIFFNQFTDFINFLEKFLARLKSLTVLNLKENIILEKKNMPNNKDIQELIAQRLTKLAILNGQQTKSLRKNDDDDNRVSMHTTVKIIPKEQKNQQNVYNNKIQNKQQIIESNYHYQSSSLINSFISVNDQPQEVISDKKSTSLIQIIKYLENANNNPGNALDHLKNLSKSVDIIVKNNQKNEEDIQLNFAQNLPDGQIKNLIESFMQNTLLLIDNHAELQNIMLSILAKLSMIQYQNFGIGCFKTLKDLMKSGRQMEQKCSKVVEDEIISKMKQNDPTKIQISLFVGLNQLIKDTENYYVLESLYERYFPDWIQSYCKKLQQCDANGTEFGNDDHYDTMISILSQSSRNDVNALQIVKNKMVENIIFIIDRSNLQYNRYIPILELVGNLSNYNQIPVEAQFGLGDKLPIASDSFMEHLVHNILLEQISSSLQIYKKNKSLQDETSQDTIEQLLLKYKTLAAEITSLGFLLASQYRELIINDNQEICEDILSIMSHQKTDPVLLTAICSFALNLLSCEEIKSNKELMLPFYERLSNLRFMLPYMGDEMLGELMQMTKVYYDSEKTLVNIDKKEQKDKKDKKDNKDSTNVQETTIKLKNKKNKKDEVVLTQEEINREILKSLDDPIINELIKALIKLIAFFCREETAYNARQQELQYNARQQDNMDNDNDLFNIVSQSLNQNGRRAKCLFRCLLIPDDRVKFEVVRCLYVVQIDQFNADEISEITQIMSSCNNIGAGDTQEILSVILWICTKLVLTPFDEELENSAQIFQTKFGEKCINESLDILKRNLGRQINPKDKEDDLSKYGLSASIVTFLKASTRNENMAQYLNAKGQIFKDILLNEDEFSTPLVKDIPIDIETTIIGQDIDTLFETISGKKTLSPYSDVSLRILMQLADSLMGLIYCFPLDLIEADQINGVNILQEIFDHQQKCYQHRKKLEKQIFVDQPLSYIAGMNDIEKQYHEKRHYSFAKKDGVELLKSFLTSKYAQNEEMMLQVCDPNIKRLLSKSKEDQMINLQYQMETEKAKLEAEFKDKYYDKQDVFKLDKALFLEYQEQNTSQNQSLKQNNQQTQQKEDDENQQQNKWKENCVNCDEQQFINSMQFEETARDFELQTGKVNQAELENVLQIKYRDDMRKKKLDDPSGENSTMKEYREDGFQNQELRSLQVAAFLRCLYAVIEFSPSISLRIQAIQMIQEPQMFKYITLLCDSTHWDESANITSKYLRIARNIITMPIGSSQEDIDRLFHYQIVSIVLEKSLSRIIEKMKKDITLTISDYATNYEVAYTSLLIIQQSNCFPFSSKDIVKLYNQTELRKIRLLQGSNTKITKEFIKREANGKYKDKGLEYKCQPIYRPKQMTLENFKVDMVDLRNKRSIQEILVEILVLKLFSKNTIISTIEILFKDMASDQKIFKDAYEAAKKLLETEPDEENLDNINQQNQNILEEEDYLQKQHDGKFQIDLDQYMEIKNLSTIEKIKNIVGEIMQSCRGQLEYQIIQYIIKGTIFEKKQLRESFMQEMIQDADNAAFRIGLMNYLNANQKTQQDEDIDFRIIELAKVDMNYYIGKGIGNSNVYYNEPRDNVFVQRIFVITNKSIQVMKSIKPSEQCSRCPPQAFCKRGPINEFRIDFDQIQTLVTFPQIPQKIIIKFTVTNFDGKKEDGVQQHEINLNIQNLSKAGKFVMVLSQAIKYHQALKREKLESQADQSKKQQEFTYLIKDKLVQFELRQIIKQIFTDISSEDAVSVQFMTACYQETDIVNKTFMQKIIETKSHSSSVQQNKLKRYLVEGEDTVELSLFKNSILISVVNGKIIILKEKMENWSYLNLTQFEEYGYRYSLSKIENVPQKIEEFGPADEFQKLRMQECVELYSKLFTVASIIDLEDVEFVQFHKGIKASLKLLIKDKNAKPPKDGEKEQFRYVIIQFLGDQERQMILGSIWDWKNNMGEEEDENQDEQNALQGEDSDDQNQQQNNSLVELDASLIIYD